MTLLLSTAVLGLAWFAVVNAAASIPAVLAGRFALGRARRCPPGVLLSVRLFPAAVAAVFVAAIFVPAHWLFEPPDPDETFGLILWTAAAGSVAMLVRSARRARAVAVASAALRRSIHRHLPAPLKPASIVPGYTGISLAGIFRTHILVGREANDALAPAELDLAIAHEEAHRTAYDNLKRAVMFCAPDIFGFTRTARMLEARWSAEAECLADRRAVRGDETRALHLASALIKVARLRETGNLTPAVPVWSTFHQAALLETRIRTLMDPPAPQPARLSAGFAPAAAVAGALAALWLAGAPGKLHQVTELAVALLP